ncbi:DUF397 domain-containing protein [Streptomyces sp. NPDC005562]|uniref:DUF397 domain-containing protein n=1 Tax=unclassified Streptomyces TaxID=2593676 RepID=UPI0033BC53CD
MSVQWQKSSFSGAGGENCVELAPQDPRITLRESETPDDTLTVTPKALAALIRGLRDPRRAPMPAAATAHPAPGDEGRLRVGP